MGERVCNLGERDDYYYCYYCYCYCYYCYYYYYYYYYDDDDCYCYCYYYYSHYCNNNNNKTSMTVSACVTCGERLLLRLLRSTSRTRLPSVVAQHRAPIAPEDFASPGTFRAEANAPFVSLRRD